jgi:hypothetical protein
MNSMCESIRRRPMYRRVVRRTGRSIEHKVVRSSTRSALREAWRTVIPYDGPSLNDICALLGRYIRLANAYEKKWNPAPRQSRFKPLCSAEESRRKFEEDLQRCYGQHDQFQRPAENFSSSDKDSASPAHAHEIAISPGSEKKDVTAVPLIRTSSGLLGLDWSAAK